MSASRTLRPVTASEWDTWWHVKELAFGDIDAPEAIASWRAVTELDRTIAAFEDGEMIGTTGAFSLRMTVPGGELIPLAGVTAVAVKPTHRRRGILTSMMRHQLDGLHDSGEAVAALVASEPGIYGRFGYGQASSRYELTIPRGSELVVPAGTDRVALSIADVREARTLCDGVFEAVVAGRPGMLARPDAWSRRMATDVRDPHGGSPLRCVLARLDGEVTGYARYTTATSWSPSYHTGTVDVREVYAVDAASYAALWRFLIDQDLMSTVNASGRPVDDPLLSMLTDPRSIRPQLVDGVYVPLVDVGRALASRTYQGLIDVILDVTDEFCPWNAGRWRLIGDEKGAACERTRTGASSDLRIGVRELGAAFLGGVTLKALAAAGRVEELRHDALANTSQAFAHDPAPWLSHSF